MGASIIWKVRVLKTHEEVIEISALTSSDAIDEAKKLSDVIHVLSADPEFIEPIDIPF